MSQRTYSHYVYGRTTQTRTHAGGPTDTDITEAEHADQCTLGGWSHTTDRTGRHYLLTTARTADMPDTGHGKYSTGGRISRLQKKTTGSDEKTVAARPLLGRFAPLLSFFQLRNLVRRLAVAHSRRRRWTRTASARLL